MTEAGKSVAGPVHGFSSSGFIDTTKSGRKEPMSGMKCSQRSEPDITGSNPHRISL
jgi:hypothetical protein